MWFYVTNRPTCDIHRWRYKGLSRPPSESLFQLTKHDRTRGHTLKLSKHCSNRDVRLYFFSERVINNWITWTNLSLRLAARIHSNGDYMNTEMTRWTYLWINIRMVLGRIRSLLLVRPYQVNNQVNAPVTIRLANAGCHTPAAYLMYIGYHWVMSCMYDVCNHCITNNFYPESRGTIQKAYLHFKK